MLKTVTIGSHNILINYRPKVVKNNMITSVELDGRPLYEQLQDSHFQTNGVDMVINEHVWEISNIVFDVIKQIKIAGNNKLAFHVADYFFNRLGGIYNTLMQSHLLMPSVNLWIRVCRKIWEWESHNRPYTIHKGTPYFFLAFTLARLGNWDSAFAFIFNAIEEDKNSYASTGFPERYKDSPAYRFATLVDNRANTFYPHVQMEKTWLLKMMRNFRKFTGLHFSYKDFESRFLREIQLEEIVFVFVYQVQQILYQESMTTNEIRYNEFSKLKNLNVIFNLCLVVDKVLEFRCRALPKKERETIADNIFNFFRERGWISTERNAGELKGEFTRSGTNLSKDPDFIVPRLFARNVSFHGSIISSEMIPLLLTWHLRNYGGHNIKTQNVLVSEYPKIVEYVVYSLFLALL